MALFGKRAPKDPWPKPQRRLRAWLRDHRRVAAETLRFISSRIGTSLLVWLLVGIALALPAGLFLLRDNLLEMTDQWQGRPGLSVYFEVGAKDSSIAALTQQLQAHKAIAQVEVVSQEQALKDFQAFGGVAEALEIIGQNPLPASLRALLTDSAELADLERAARIARQGEQVAEVVVEQTWAERVIEISRLLARLGVVLAALFGLGAVLVTAASVRLAIESRLEEVRVMKLVGATEAQIRRPFLYFGGYYGIGGAIVAAMLLSLTLVIIEPPLTRLLASYDRPLNTGGFGPIFVSVLLAVGAVLGVWGALVAASARLRQLDVA